MGHQSVFDQIILRKYLPKIKAYKERWNHQKKDINVPITNAYTLNENGYSRFTYALRYYKEQSRPMIYEIIICLLKEYGVVYKELPITGENINVFSENNKDGHLWLTQGVEERPFMKCVIIKKDDRDVLLVFRDFGINNTISINGLKNMHEAFSFDEYFYVSFAYEKAYEEIVNHNDDIQDATRGTHCLSLKDFFQMLFDSSEYDLFYSYMEKYKKEVIEYLGITVARTLQPNAIPGFKKDMIDSIKQKDYYSTLCSLCPNHMPTQVFVEKTKEQFIQSEYYKALVSNSKFAMSFLTAEWLYSTLYNVVTVDQTPITLGYFKSMEQLLFDYISLQGVPAKANKLRTIKLDKSKPELLNETLIQDKGENMTLGTFTGFLAYIGNHDLIRSELRLDPSLDATGFIIDFIKPLKDLRNEYLHRENINNWNIVKKARDIAYALYFIILGAYTFDKNEKTSIGIPDNSVSVSPSVLLCEYIQKRATEEHDVFEIPVFYVNKNYKQPLWADPDVGINYDKYGNITYSGVYFHNAGYQKIEDYKELSYTIDTFGTLMIEEDRYIIGKMNPFLSGVKGVRKVIYENGVFTPYE